MERVSARAESSVGEGVSGAPECSLGPADAECEGRHDSWKAAPSAAVLHSDRGLALARSLGAHDGAVDSIVLEGEEGAEGCAGLAQEAPRLLRLAAPLAAANVCSFAVGLVNVAFVGRLGEEKFAVAVLATSLFNVTGLSVLQGFNAALETFCGQAWGAGSYRAVGLSLQRALLMMCVVSGAVAALWSRAESLLLALGQDAALSRGAGRYIMIMAPALLLAGAFEALKRFLAAQGLGRPGTVATLAALLLSPLFNWALIYGLDLGLDGAALAVNCTELTMVAVAAGFAVALEWRRAATGDPRRTWFGWSPEAVQGWGQYLRYAAPSIVMICTEWWLFEAMVLMSGWLPAPQTAVATIGICMNLSGVVWMLINGISLACSSRVANSLGAGLPQAARRATHASLALGLAVEAVAVAAVIPLRGSIARVFTAAPTTVAAVAALMPVFAASLPGDGTNIVLQGLLRGSGKQAAGAVTNVCSYWLVGLPTAYYLAFQRGWALQGLWAGIACVNTLQGAVMLVIMLRFDFRAEATKAKERTQALLMQPLLLDGDEEEAAGESAQ